MKISIIAAIGKNRELGKDNDLIWKVSDDLKRFKELTTGHPIIMGDITFASIGRPLPNRTNIVLTRQKNLIIDGCEVVHSIEDAIETASQLDDTAFVIGGAEVYMSFLPYARELYITHINAEDSEADVFFPEFANLFEIKKEHAVRALDDLSYQWIDYERI